MTTIVHELLRDMCQHHRLLDYHAIIIWLLFKTTIAGHESTFPGATTGGKKTSCGTCTCYRTLFFFFPFYLPFFFFLFETRELKTEKISGNHLTRFRSSPVYKSSCVILELDKKRVIKQANEEAEVKYDLQEMSGEGR